MVIRYTLITGIEHLDIFRYSAIVTSGDEDVSPVGISSSSLMASSSSYLPERYA